MNIRGVLKATKIFIIDHAPEILTAVGTIGLITSGIMAVNETPKAMDILEEHASRVDVEEPLTKKEKFVDCIKVYWPSILLATSSVACIIFARRIDSSRAAALVTAYKMSEEALTRLEDSTREEYGEKKLKKLQDNANLKDMNDHPADDICVTGNGNELFYDCYSAKYFRSSVRFIEKALNSYEKDILDQDYEDINEWIMHLGLPAMDDDIGSQLGINSSMVRSEGLHTEITYGPGPLDEPCGYLKLSIRPVPNYWNPHG